MKFFPGFITGLIIGIVVTYFICFLFFIPEESSSSAETSMIRFLVNLEKGQAISYENLPDGRYRIDGTVDGWTILVTQIIPLGNIPMIVINTPQNILALAQKEGGYIEKYPVDKKEW